LDAGHNKIIGSWLLDGKALEDRKGLKKAYKQVAADGDMISAFMVGGKNVMNAESRGENNSVNSAWSRAYVHTGARPPFPTQYMTKFIVVVTVSWPPFDAVKKAAQENKPTNVLVDAWRELAPDMGAYINEVCLCRAA
jgi:hypothetical protein